MACNLTATRKGKEDTEEAVIDKVHQKISGGLPFDYCTSLAMIELWKGQNVDS